MTAPLADYLRTVFGREGLILHGSTPVKERQKLVARFQAADGPPFFVLSLKAGGTGLNLTAASHVLHFDRWWKANARFTRQALVDQARKWGLLEELIGCQGDKALNASQNVCLGLGLERWQGRELVDAQGRRFWFDRRRQKNGVTYRISFGSKPN